jgi:hypothetical protein
MTSGAVQRSKFKVHPSRHGADAAPQGERVDNSEPCPELRRRGGTWNTKRVRA